MFLVHASSGGRLFFFCGSSLVATFGYFSGYFIGKVTVKVCFMPENCFFVSCIILGIVNKPFWCQIDFVLLCLHN